MSAPIRCLAARMEAESMRARLHGSPENSNVDSSNWRCRWRRARPPFRAGLLLGWDHKAWVRKSPRRRRGNKFSHGCPPLTLGRERPLGERQKLLKNPPEQNFMG